MKKPNCFENPNNPSSIDLFLRNHARSFQNTTTLENGLSNSHKMIVTVIKVHYKKQNKKSSKTEATKHFQKILLTKVKNELLKININNAEF